MSIDYGINKNFYRTLIFVLAKVVKMIYMGNNSGDEVPLTRHFFIRWHKDQAARVFDPLAWSW